MGATWSPGAEKGMGRSTGGGMHPSEVALLELKQVQPKGASTWSWFYLAVLIQTKRLWDIPIYS